MKREELFEILGETDDELVESAAHTNAIHQKMTWRQWILTAACVALIVGAVIPFAKAASEGRSWISVLLLWQEKAADDPVEPGTDQGDRMKKSGEFVENNISQEAIVKRASETLSF